MKTVNEAIKFIEMQFEDYEAKYDVCEELVDRVFLPYHYGKLELVSLLSYIYEIQNEDVQIKKR